MSGTSEISKLAQLLDRDYREFLVEAGHFLDCVEQLHGEGLGLCASREVSPLVRRIEQLPFRDARRRAAGGGDLAVFCYSWTLRRLALDMTIVAVDWESFEIGPIDLRDFAIARQVRGLD